MWTTPLSATGTDPATHYISSGYIPAEFVGLSPCTTWAQDEQGNWVVVDHVDGNAVLVATYAGMAGVDVTAAEVEGIFARSDVSKQEPFVALGRAGLKIINPPDAL